MLTISDDLSAFQLAAGEPFVLDLRLRDAEGHAVPLGARAFILSFHDADRVTHAAIDGEIATDAAGDQIRFVRDGRFSASLYGWPLTVELAERYRDGRDVIARGMLTVLPSAGEVASLDAGVVAAQAVRVTIRAGADGAAPLFTQARVPFDAPSAAPPPPPPPPPAPMLAALSLPATDWTVGVAVDLAVAGMTAGSALQAVLPPGLTLAAGRIAGTPGDAGAATLVLTETLAGAGNSPRTTTIPITVAAAAVEPDAVLPPHPIGPVDLGTQSAIPLRTMAVEPYMVGARFRRATNTVDFWFRMTEGGDGLIFRIVDDDHYRLIRVIDGVESGIGGHEYLTFAPALVAAPGSAFLELRVSTDGSATFHQDGVPVAATIDAAFLDAIQPRRGRGVRLAVTVGPAMANVTAGSLVPPLAIRSATFDPVTRRIDVAIAYAGTPDGYDQAIGDGGWAPARTLSSAQPGQAVLRLPALAPGITGAVTVSVRQRGAPDIRAATSVTD